MVVLLAALGVQVVREPRGPRRDGSHAEAWARRTTVLKHTTLQRCAPPSPSFRMGNTDARRSFSPVLALLAIPALLAAQLPQADEAFRRGDYAAARAGYERVLAADSLNEHALFRLATLDSWDGKLARSLWRFDRLRRLDPNDEDVRVAQAQVLAWAGHTKVSLVLYDSVLARSPGRVDALAGRARVVAWRGDLARAATPSLRWAGVQCCAPAWARGGLSPTSAPPARRSPRNSGSVSIQHATQP